MIDWPVVTVVGVIFVTYVLLVIYFGQLAVDLALSIKHYLKKARKARKNDR